MQILRLDKGWIADSLLGDLLLGNIIFISRERYFCQNTDNCKHNHNLKQGKTALCLLHYKDSLCIQIAASNSSYGLRTSSLNPIHSRGTIRHLNFCLRYGAHRLWILCWRIYPMRRLATIQSATVLSRNHLHDYRAVDLNFDPNTTPGTKSTGCKCSVYPVECRGFEVQRDSNEWSNRSITNWNQVSESFYMFWYIFPMFL